MLAPVRTAAPSTNPVTLVEAKAHCDITYDGDDDLIDLLIEAATSRFDGWSGVLGRCIVTQTWRVDLTDWPACGIIRLPFPDIQSISSVKYYDSDDVEQTVNSSQYAIYHDAKGGFLRFADNFTYPAAYSDRLDAVQVVFLAGFGDASAVPPAIKAAILMTVAHLYENREATTDLNMIEVPHGVRALVDPFRRRTL